MREEEEITRGEKPSISSLDPRTICFHYAFCARVCASTRRGCEIKECYRLVSALSALSLSRASGRTRERLSNWSGSTLGESDLDLIRQIETRGVLSVWEEWGDTDWDALCMRYRVRGASWEISRYEERGYRGGAYVSRISSLPTVWFLFKIFELVILWCIYRIHMVMEEWR